MAEDPISSFCNGLASFCNHLHSTSEALKQSIGRRPIPLDSASSTFVQCLNQEFRRRCTRLDESLSLKKLGLSDACLATLASEDNLSPQEPEILQEFKLQHQPVLNKMVSSEGMNLLSYEEDKENLKSAEAHSSMLKILESEFECLPGYMKGLASWEDLLVAVDKINSSLSKKTDGCNFLR